jgi:hypothetical protein
MGKKKIRIWKDKWLPRPSTFLVRSPPILLDPNAMVSELINEDAKCWDLVLLEANFIEDEVHLIQSLPVRQLNREDVRV